MITIKSDFDVLKLCDVSKQLLSCIKVVKTFSLTRCSICTIELKCNWVFDLHVVKEKQYDFICIIFHLVKYIWAALISLFIIDLNVFLQKTLLMFGLVKSQIFPSPAKEIWKFCWRYQCLINYTFVPPQWPPWPEWYYYETVHLCLLNMILDLNNFSQTLQGSDNPSKF